MLYCIEALLTSYIQTNRTILNPFGTCIQNFIFGLKLEYLLFFRFVFKYKNKLYYLIQYSQVCVVECLFI